MIVTSVEGQNSQWNIDGNLIKIIIHKKYKPTAENILGNISRIKENMKNKENLIEITSEIGNTNVLRIAKSILHETTLEYISYYVKQFTEERDKLGIGKLVKRVFGIKLDLLGKIDDLKDFLIEIQEVVDKEYMNQCKVFVNNNYKEMSLQNESWDLYWTKGPGLNSRVFDFTKLDNSKIRKEVMLYFKEKLKAETDFRSDRNLAIITRGMNFICSNNSKVYSCTDISKNDISALLLHLETDARTQHNKPLTTSTIRKTVQSCGVVVRFMIDFYKNTNNKQYKDIENPFDEVHFRNTSNMEKKTKPIPENVFEQLKLYKQKLIPKYQLICDIFELTGLRAKEAVYLKEHDVYYDKEVEAWVLKYIPFKTLKKRRKKNMPDHHSIVIPENLGLAIKEQEDETRGLREKFNLPFIFINETKSGGHRLSLTQAQAFVDSLNRLAKKHDIVDEDGVLWHFTSRQYRKTVAINMVENGASEQEIALQLSHLDSRTSKVYYAEVRKMRLAEMNGEFFKKKFDIALGDEQLNLYTEEERKVLYIDFRLKYREVELGMCSKHISQGPCGLRVGKANCATCRNLCTGLKYLDKWTSLKDSQKETVDKLLCFYIEKNITEYEYYKEYRREIDLLKSYQDVIDNINKERENANVR